MEIEVGIGEEIVTKKGEHGTLVKMNEEYIFTNFTDRPRLYQSNAFDKGYISCVKPSVQEAIKNAYDEYYAELKRIEEEKKLAEEEQKRAEAAAEERRQFEAKFGFDYNPEYLLRDEPYIFD